MDKEVKVTAECNTTHDYSVDDTTKGSYITLMTDKQLYSLGLISFRALASHPRRFNNFQHLFTGTFADLHCLEQ